MANPRGVLILDIDGTINPFYARHTLEENPGKLPGFEEHSIRDELYGDARVFLQTAVLRDVLPKLQALGIELLWGSAWNESSNLILRMLFPEGFTDWPTIIFPEEIDFSPSVQSWKLSTVQPFIEERYGRRTTVLWADDEIFGDAESWLRSRSAPGLLIRPDRHRGLTESHWATVLEFAGSLGPSARSEGWSARDEDGSHLFRSI